MPIAEPAAESPFAPLTARLEAAERRILDAARPLHAAARRRRPDAGAWCVDEILDHLAATTEAYLPALDRALTAAAGRSPRKTSSLQPSFLGRWLLRSLAPGTRPLKAPRAFRPRVSKSGDSISHDAQDRLALAHRGLRDAMLRAAPLESSRIKIASPAFALLRFNLDDVFASLVAHVERHGLQLERTIARVSN
jgi:hypothetical protein